MALLPVRDRVLFPQMVTPLPVGRPRSLRAIEYALAHDQTVFIVAQRDAEQDEVDPADLYSIGTEAVIGRVLKLPDGNSSVLVQGQRRMKIVEFVQLEPLIMVRAVPLPDEGEATGPADALMKNVLGLFEKCVKLNRNLPEDAYVAAMNVETPGRLADLIASTIDLDAPPAGAPGGARPRRAPAAGGRPADQESSSLLEMESQIHSEVQQEVDKSQREFGREVRGQDFHLLHHVVVQRDDDAAVVADVHHRRAVERDGVAGRADAVDGVVQRGVAAGAETDRLALVELGDHAGQDAQQLEGAAADDREIVDLLGV